MEIEVDEEEAKAFYSEKGAEAFQKHVVKKGFVEERGFKKIVLSFKEEIEKRGWEKISQHMESRRRAIFKEFYANLGERKGLTCYVRGRWVPFWGKGHLPIFGAKTSGRLRKIGAA